MGTTGAVRQRTREMLGMLKTGEETYDDVITLLRATHPNRLTWAELNRRFRSDEFEPVADRLAESRTRRARGLERAISVHASPQGSGGVLPTAARRSVCLREGDPTHVGRSVRVRSRI